MNSLRSSVAIAGVGETRLGKVPEYGCLQLYALAAKQAIEEAGLTIADIDGVLTIDSMAEPAVFRARVSSRGPAAESSTSPEITARVTDTAAASVQSPPGAAE